MLGFFPEPYPDELLYSVLVRYYVRSGYSNFIFAAEDLFQNRHVRPSFEYFPALKYEVVSKLTEDKSFEKVILQHTMFPYHCRFLPIDRKQSALQSIIRMDNNYHDLILFPKRKITPTMRYCPLCASEDRKNYGETYWHRIHQIQELTICPTHHCFLVNTDYKLSGKSSPNLIPAEIVIPYNKEAAFCEDEKLCALADYINDVFHLPAISEKECPISQVLNKKTENTKYRSPRGAVCRITSLYKDFACYYSGLFADNPEQWEVHKIITGQRFDFFEITLLGFFLGLKPNEFLNEPMKENPQHEVFDNQIQKLHNQGLSYPKIANAIKLPLDTIKNAAYQQNRTVKHKARKNSETKPQKKNWDSLDSDLLPKIIETINELKQSAKPRRITIGLVSRMAGLKPKQIDKLPLCKAEIKKYYQTQEEFWAEKVLWAWRNLSNEGRTISIKQIRLQTNMSTEQIRRSLVELKTINQNIYDEIVKLMTRSDDS